MFKRKQRDGMGIGLRDLEKKSPRRSDEPSAPEPERPFDSAREARSPNLEERHPSQAEGERRE